MGCGCNNKIVQTTNETSPVSSPVIQPSLVDNASQSLVYNSNVVNTIVNTEIPHSYNILNVVQDALGGNLRYVSNDVYDFRLDQCHGCQHLIIGVCDQCGCIVKLKAKYEQSSCKIGKW